MENIKKSTPPDLDTLMVPPGWCRIEPGRFLMGTPEIRDVEKNRFFLMRSIFVHIQGGQQGVIFRIYDSWATMKMDKKASSKEELFFSTSLTTDKGDESDSLQHEVIISRPFAIKSIPVTCSEWCEWMLTSPWHFRSVGFNPVETVNWYDALFYCNRMSRREGFESCYEFEGIKGIAGCSLQIEVVKFKGLSCNGYRLPTEAEWEYAAWAGSDYHNYDYSPLERPRLNGPIRSLNYGSNSRGEDEESRGIAKWGDPNKLGDVAWYSRNTMRNTTHPVGKKIPNAWGLYDMLGNVWEWCWDFSKPYSTELQRDPIGPEEGFSRVLRGGSWGNATRDCGPNIRFAHHPIFRLDYVGFRLVRTLEV